MERISVINLEINTSNNSGGSTVSLQENVIIGKFSLGQLSRKLKRALSIIIHCTW